MRLRWLARAVLLPYYTWRLGRLQSALERDTAELRMSMTNDALLLLGYITQQWAAVEVILDFSNKAIAAKLPRREPFPLALAKKLDMYKRGHNQIPELADIKADGLALAAGVRDLGKKRHDVVHGMAMGSLHEQVIQIYRHTVPKDEVSWHIVKGEWKGFDRDDLWPLAVTIFELTKRLLAHDRLIAARLSEDEADDGPS